MEGGRPTGKGFCGGTCWRRPPEQATVSLPRCPIPDHTRPPRGPLERAGVFLAGAWVLRFKGRASGVIWGPAGAPGLSALNQHRSSFLWFTDFLYKVSFA